MRKLFTILFLLAFIGLASAQSTNRITVQITVTNATTNGFAFILNGDQRTVTNTPPSASWFRTNHTIAGSASNLYNNIVANPFTRARVYGYTNGSNVIYMRGDLGVAMSASALSNWIHVSYSTQVFSAGLVDVRVPMATEQPNQATNIASLLVTGISDYSTNTFATNATALANHISVGPSVQVLLNDVLTNGHVTGGAVSNLYMTNISRANISLLVATNYNLLGGTVSNATLTNVAWLNGTLGGLTNGRIQNAFITNSPAVQTTNLTAFGGYLSNMIVHSLIATNFDAPGAGVGSLVIGENTTAIGQYAIAIGDESEATNAQSIAIGYDASSVGIAGLAFGSGASAAGPYSVAVGNDAVGLYHSGIAIGFSAQANHSNSIAIGYTAVTTTTNEVVLGTASERVSIPGQLWNVTQTNSTFRGTNIWNGDLAFTPRVNTGLANGYNSGVILGSNVYIRLSGPSGAYTNVGFAGGRSGLFYIVQADNPGLSHTILNDSGLEATAANRILTGTGALVNMTNQPAIYTLIYDEAVSRYRLVNFSR